MAISSLAEQVTGAWSLVSFTQETQQGEVSYPLGSDAKGSIYYLPNGFVSVHIMKTDRSEYVKPELYAEGRLKYTDLGYLAYSGKYSFNQSQTIITHHIAISAFPEWVGGQQVRVIELDGDHLSLSSDGSVGPDKITFRLLWKRER
jgi:hypothetical protein